MSLRIFSFHFCNYFYSHCFPTIAINKYKPQCAYFSVRTRYAFYLQRLRVSLELSSCRWKGFLSWLLIYAYFNLIIFCVFVVGVWGVDLLWCFLKMYAHKIVSVCNHKSGKNACNVMPSSNMKTFYLLWPCKVSHCKKLQISKEELKSKKYLGKNYYFFL